MNLIITHSFLILKYIFLFGYFYLSGRSFIEITNRYLLKEKVENIFYIKKNTIYPILGIFFTGNLLLFLHYIFPLKSLYVLLILFLSLFGNLYNLSGIQNLSIDIPKILIYIFIPSVLIFSSYDTSWHYDAGFYHLNHQNWLRESNMIIGTINISWTYGMSSIYEYISSILWIDKSYILIHFLSLIFIHVFYIFLFENVNNTINNSLKNISLLLIVFSLLDNFGIEGGRNGFLYIQGVTKQDMAIAVLVLMIFIFGVLSISTNKLNSTELFILSTIVLLAIQIKISSLVIIYILIVCIFKSFYFKLLNNRAFFVSITSSLFFATNWLIKNYLTTGCFMFPITFTCKNNFAWYVEGSTKEFETISTTASYAFIDYFYRNLTFQNWFRDFLSFEINKVVLSNFLISFLLIIFLKLIFSYKNVNMFITNFTMYSFVFIYAVYLILYGPIPRYLTGLFLIIIAFIGFNIKNFKIEINKYSIYFLIMLSVVTIVRSNSYLSFFNNKSLALFEPVGIAKYVEYKDDWVRPDIGDQCWINLNCTMDKVPPTITQDGFFKIAYK